MSAIGMGGLATTLLIFGSLFVLLILGLPLAYCMGGVAIGCALLFWGPNSIYMFVGKMWDSVNNFTLVALPLFVMMAGLLQSSGIAEELYSTMRKLMGGLKGGLAIGSIVISAIFAAMSGLSATATISLGVIAVPSMLKYGYDKRLVSGSIQAGGALGILIPPSVMMIVYGMIAQTSVGQLFIAGILPGLLLVVLFIVYISVRCLINPKMGPPLPADERVSTKEKLLALKSVVPPIIVIIVVIGSIYTGIAGVTEAAALGTFTVLIIVLIQRKLTWQGFKESLRSTMKSTAMVVWIMLASSCFTAVYQAMGSSDFIQTILMSVPGGKWGIFIVMQLTFFLLGMILDPTGIIMLTAPIYLPVAIALGFDPVWYGIIFVMNMEMSYLTPPFGFNLFYMKAIVPPEVTMGDIYKSIVPFVGLQMLGLIICCIFPGIVLWLPSLM